jgi:hypothetical protein
MVANGAALPKVARRALRRDFFALVDESAYARRSVCAACDDDGRAARGDRTARRRP